MFCGRFLLNWDLNSYNSVLCLKVLKESLCICVSLYLSVLEVKLQHNWVLYKTMIQNRKPNPSLNS